MSGDVAIGAMFITVGVVGILICVGVLIQAAVQSWRHRNDWRRRVFREARRRGEWPR